MGEKKNIRMILEYDGTRYHGWQRQKNDMTIQSVIEESIRTMTGESVLLLGSGRTDAGVHALNQICNFFTYSEIEPDSMVRGLNSLLPDDIFISMAEYVPLYFHSRYSAKSKAYEYRVWNRKEPNIFLRDFSWHVDCDLNIEEMSRCVEGLKGIHDFSSFRSSGSSNKNPVREMIRAEVYSPAESMQYFLFEANGFLRHMVRNIVGTAIDVGKGKMDFDGFMEIFLSRDRKKAGIKAPPQGLFLKLVRY